MPLKEGTQAFPLGVQDLRVLTCAPGVGGEMGAKKYERNQGKSGEMVISSAYLVFLLSAPWKLDCCPLLTPSFSASAGNISGHELKAISFQSKAAT